MPRSLASCLFVFSLALVAASAPRAQVPAGNGQPPVAFATDIRPMLEAKCLGCHGEKLKLSQLDLRTRESAIEGGAHGPSLVPGNAEQSRLYRLVAGLEEPAMPMRGEALTAARGRRAEALDRRGRDLGCRRRRRPPRRRRRLPPSRIGRSPTRSAATGRSSRRCRRRCRSSATPGLDHPIDRFLEQARAARGLVAAPRADRRTLVRRAYLDLLGLPPTPDEVGALRRRRSARRLGAADRHAAGVAALRRALGPALARRRPLRRLGRLRVRRPPAQRLALPRLRHHVVQRRQALRPVPHRADRRRRDGRQDPRQPDRHRLPARRAARAVPREGQPRAPLRLPRRRARRRSARARWG